MTISIVQYNILCSKLATPIFYPKCNPADLDDAKRFNLTKTKLLDHIKTNSIICLQEVPQSWLRNFNDFFTSNKYIFMPCLYGNFNNDYMGVALAYPINTYQSEDTTIINIGSTLEKVPYVPLTIIERLIRFIINLMFLLFFYLGIFKSLYDKYEKSKFDIWDYSAKRGNCVLMTKLYNIKTNSKIVISSYHMPCVFWEPKIVTIHTIALMKIIQNFAGDIPIILGCDANFTPDSYQYNIMTTGNIDVMHPEHYWNNGEKLNLIKLKSAYNTIRGSEPLYTNQTFNKNCTSIFSATIDYIFYSDNITPISIEELPNLSKDTILPNENEPSDHLLLQASFN